MAYSDYKVAEIKTEVKTSIKECGNSGISDTLHFSIPSFSKMSCQYDAVTTYPVPILSK